MADYIGEDSEAEEARPSSCKTGGAPPRHNLLLRATTQSAGGLSLPCPPDVLLVERIVGNLISHLPAGDNQNVCICVETRKVVSLKEKMAKRHMI